MTVQAIPVAIQPLVGWPHEAEQGRTYLVTVDLRLAAGAVWPYEEEEYPVYCLLGTGPTCSLRPLGTSALILHRYGGTYGPARFLLTALEPTDDAKLRLSLANRWGVPILALPLPMRIVSMSEEAPRAARDELRENVVVGTTGVGAEPSAPPTEPFGFNPNSIGFFGIIDWNYTRSLEPANVGNVQVVQELRHQRWVEQNELDRYVAEEERNNPGSPCPTLVGYEEDTRESANDVQFILKVAFSRYSEHVAIRRYLRDHKSEYDSVVRQILNGDLRQIISHSPNSNIVINVTIMSRDGKVMLMRRPVDVRVWPLLYQVGLHETMNWPAPGDAPENCFQLATRALAEEVNLTDPRDYYNRIVFSWFGYYAVEASACFFAHVKTRLSERQLMESVSKAQSAFETNNIEWMDLTKDNVRSVLQTWSNGPWEPGRDDHGWQYLPHSVMSLTQLYRITRQGMLPLLEVANIDANLLATAQGWIEAATYTEERDYLSAHEELLDDAADNAVDEVLLTVEETEAERYRGLRMVAQAQGVEAAYRPLLLRTLADEFIGADLARRRALLLERRSELLSDIVAAVVEDRVGAGDTDRVESARALLELAARDEERPVLDALEDPARFPDLLYNLAKVNSRGLAPAAMVASTVASTQAEAAVARFFLAIASAINGDGDTAREVIAEAHQLDPGQSAEWIVQLAELGQQQPAVLPLIAVLTTPHPPA